MDEDIVFRLRKRAEIRHSISSRKSVQEGKPDRIADLLEEAANEITNLRNILQNDGGVVSKTVFVVGNNNYHSFSKTGSVSCLNQNFSN